MLPQESLSGQKTPAGPLESIIFEYIQKRFTTAPEAPNPAFDNEWVQNDLLQLAQHTQNTKTLLKACEQRTETDEKEVDVLLATFVISANENEQRDPSRFIRSACRSFIQQLRLARSKNEKNTYEISEREVEEWINSIQWKNNTLDRNSVILFPGVKLEVDTWRFSADNGDHSIKLKVFGEYQTAIDEKLARRVASLIARNTPLNYIGRIDPFGTLEEIDSNKLRSSLPTLSQEQFNFLQTQLKDQSVSMAKTENGLTAQPEGHTDYVVKYTRNKYNVYVPSIIVSKKLREENLGIANQEADRLANIMAQHILESYELGSVIISPPQVPSWIQDLKNDLRVFNDQNRFHYTIEMIVPRIEAILFEALPPEFRDWVVEARKYVAGGDQQPLPYLASAKSDVDDLDRNYIRYWTAQLEHSKDSGKRSFSVNTWKAEPHDVIARTPEDVSLSRLKN